MAQKISAMMEKTERNLSVERIRIRELRTNQRKLGNDSISLTDTLATFTAKYTDLEMTLEVVDQVNEINQ